LSRQQQGFVQADVMLLMAFLHCQKARARALPFDRKAVQQNVTEMMLTGSQ
jgi:hypothetical protein